MASVSAVQVHSFEPAVKVFFHEISVLLSVSQSTSQLVFPFNISSISLRNTKKYFSLEQSEIFKREKRQVF